MPNLNTKLLDKAVSHAIYLNRFESQMVNELLPLIIKGERGAKEIFDAHLSRIMESGYTSPADSKRTERLIEVMASDIEEAREEDSFTPFALLLTSKLSEFADYETGFTVTSTNEEFKRELDGTGFMLAMATVAAGVAFNAAMAKPFSIQAGKSATTINQYISGMPSNEARRISEAVRSGVTNGASTRDIVRTVWGTVKERETGSGSSAAMITRRGAEALVRTAIAHVAQQARSEVAKANTDLIKAERVIATLDSRTTPYCQRIDNSVFHVGEGPRPPFHTRCRTVTVPVLKTYRELGININEPAESTRAYFAIPAKMNVTQYRNQLRKEGLTRAQQDKIINSLSGQTDDPDFGSFLARQSKEFQETVLGKQRTELYRKGELTIKELISPQGKYYTLDELRQLQPDAFVKAGI